MKRLRIEAFALAGIVLCASLGMAADIPAGGRSFKAELSGSEEVPPVKTEAEGEATIQISQDGNTMTYRLIVSHIKDVTAAFICKGKKGEKGQIVMELFKEPRKEDVSGTLLAEGKVEPYLLTGPLLGGSVRSLAQFMETGEVYIHILTKEHPDGEIRGQVK